MRHVSTVVEAGEDARAMARGRTEWMLASASGPVLRVLWNWIQTEDGAVVVDQPERVVASARLADSAGTALTEVREASVKMTLVQATEWQQQVLGVLRR